MQTLKCDALECMYNSNAHCSANAIQVNSTRQETYCDTYIKDTAYAGANDDNMGVLMGSVDTEFSTELAGSPMIYCTVAKCAFNNSFHCKADAVKIEEPTGAMICNCRTYKPK